MRTLWLRMGSVDLERGVVARADGETVLTALEARLLRALCTRPGEDLPRDELMASAWGHVPKGPSRALDVAIARLREKVEVDPKRPEHLITVHGIGYRFAPLAQEAAPAPPEVADPTVRFGEVIVDLHRRTVLRDGASQALSPLEAGVLQHLLAAGGRTVSEDTLHRAVYGRRPPARSRAVERTVSRIREKLEDDPQNPRWLVTVRGEGFQLIGGDAAPDALPGALDEAWDALGQSDRDLLGAAVAFAGTIDPWLADRTLPRVGTESGAETLKRLARSGLVRILPSGRFEVGSGVRARAEMTPLQVEAANDAVLEHGEAAQQTYIADDREGRRLMREEVPNLEGAFAREGRPDRVARLALILVQAHASTGDHAQALITAEAAVERAATAEVGLRVDLLATLATVLNTMGRSAEALGWLGAALDTATAASLADAEVRIRMLRGHALVAAGNLDAAERDLRRGLAVGEARGALWVGETHMQLGLLLCARDLHDDAIEHATRAVEMLQAQQRIRGAVHARVNLATILATAGRLDTAEATLRLAVEQAGGRRTLRAMALNNHGWVMHALGRVEEGRALSAEAMALFQALGSGANAAAASVQVAIADLELGRVAEALAGLRKATPLLTGRPDHFASARLWTAWALVLSGERIAAETALEDGREPISDRSMAEAAAVLVAAIERELGRAPGPIAAVTRIDAVIARRVTG